MLARDTIYERAWRLHVGLTGFSSQTVVDSFGLICRASFVLHLFVKVSAFSSWSILSASDGYRSSDFV